MGQPPQVARDEPALKAEPQKTPEVHLTIAKDSSRAPKHATRQDEGHSVPYDSSVEERLRATIDPGMEEVSVANTIRGKQIARSSSAPSQ